MKGSFLLVFTDRDLLTECLLPMLPLYDVFSLFQTHTCFHRAYKRKYNETRSTFHMFNLRIERALTQFYGEENMRILMGHMFNGTLRLTGGFLLSIINAENVFQCEDVDFVCTVGKIRDAHRTEHVRNISCTLKKAIHVSTPLNFYESVFAVDTVILNCKKLQIVSIRTKLEKYLDEFDFSFCANCYGKGKLVITSPEAVKKKSSEIHLQLKYGKYYIRNDTHKVLVNGRNRIFKYRNRGYIIIIKQKEMNQYDAVYRNFWNNFWIDV
jgi:hypothetical protein